MDNFARTNCNRLLTLTVRLVDNLPWSILVQWFFYLVLPLSVNGFDQHWWLVQPTPIDVEVEITSVAIRTALKRIADEYVDASNYRKSMLLDHVTMQSQRLAFVILCKFRRVACQRG